MFAASSVEISSIVGIKRVGRIFTLLLVPIEELLTISARRSI
jgi:hypothetical protein